MKKSKKNENRIHSQSQIYHIIYKSLSGDG